MTKQGVQIHEFVVDKISLGQITGLGKFPQWFQP